VFQNQCICKIARTLQPNWCWAVQPSPIASIKKKKIKKKKKEKRKRTEPTGPQPRATSAPSIDLAPSSGLHHTSPPTIGRSLTNPKPKDKTRPSPATSGRRIPQTEYPTDLRTRSLLQTPALRTGARQRRCKQGSVLLNLAKRRPWRGGARPLPCRDGLGRRRRPDDARELPSNAEDHLPSLLSRGERVGDGRGRTRERGREGAEDGGCWE
jgi:hypothetical protein